MYTGGVVQLMPILPLGRRKEIVLVEARVTKQNPRLPTLNPSLLVNMYVNKYVEGL